jgi:2-octaprenyl-6-methoxyphenol hydroxylase
MPSLDATIAKLPLPTLDLPVASPQLDYDIAIVGGGIVGNTLAVALQNSGLRVVSIESQAESISVAKSRAYVLSMLPI